MRRAISVELREVALRLLGVIFLTESRFGNLNRELLQWMYPLMEKYEGLHAKNPMNAAVSELVKLLLTLNETQFENQVKQLKTTAPASQIEGRIDADYTRATITQVHDFEPDYAVRVLDLLTHLRFFNDSRDSIMFWNRLTFTPNLTKESYDNAIQNQSFARSNMVTQSRGIIEMIAQLEEKYPPPNI